MKGKKMKHRIRGITAWILSFAAVISSVQMTVYAVGEEIRDSVISDSGDIEKAEAEEISANPEYTEGRNDEEIYETVPYIIGENEELRDEHEKHYRLSDGTEIAAVYTNPVHYIEDGKWKEYDHTLVRGMNGYIPTGDNMGICFSSDPSSEEIFSYSEAGHSISMSVHSEEKQRGSGESDSVLYSALPHLYTGEIGDSTGKSESGEISSDGEPNGEDNGAYLYNAFNPLPGGAEGAVCRITAGTSPEVSADTVYDVKSSLEAVEEFKLVNPEADEKEIAEAVENQNRINEEQSREIMNTPVNTGTIRYDGMLEGASLEYTVGTGYIKENIILSEPGENYEYNFKFETELTAVLEEDGSVSFCDGDEIIFFIPAPYMYDADGNISDNVSYSVTAGNGNTILSVKADSKWIESGDRVFPVTIDPTLISKGYTTGVIRDGYVQEGSSGEEAVGTLYTG